MDLQDAISEIRAQQKVSMERMDILKHQHEQWQKTVADLLAKADSMKMPQVNVQPERPVAPSGDFPEVLDIGLDEFEGESRPLGRDSTPSTDIRRSRQPKKLEVSQGPLKKLVAEVMMDHDTMDHFGDFSWWQRQKRAVCRFVNSKHFEYITGVIILLNMIMIGVEAGLSIENGDIQWATWIERAFLTVYTVELSLRLFVGGRQLFKSPWFLLDFSLVCVGIIALVVAPILGQGTLGGIEFEKVLVVRGLRLLRLARALRMVGHFKVIWRLVYGILTAGHTMLSVTCLVALWLFIFGCVAVEIITKDVDLRSNPETQSIVQHAFGTLPRSILTLLQFVTMDSIADVYFPLIMAKPWLLIYFMPILLFFSVALMNLVTAVLVEHALEYAAHEAEAERLKTKSKIKAALPALLDIFHRLDTDESGCITREEIAHVPLDMLPPKLLETVSVDSMTDLFELLDVDGGGTLTQNEFVEGLLNLVLLDVPIWTIQTLKLLRLIRGITLQIGDDVKHLKHVKHGAIGNGHT